MVSPGNLQLVIEDVPIVQVDKTKYLGVINSKLNWTDHINEISNKISKNTGVIFKVCQNLNSDTAYALSLIQPYLLQCIATLFGLLVTVLIRCVISQVCYPCHNICFLECSYCSNFLIS